MKRFNLAVFAMVVLAMLIPCSPIVASPGNTPHEDPGTIMDSPNPVMLLLFYGDVFDLASISKYMDAKSLLEDIKNANIPDEIQYIIDRYNSLSHDLFSGLDAAEGLLYEASELLVHYRLEEAEIKLDSAEAAISNAQFLMVEIEAATNTLGDKLGAFLPAVSGELKQAYDRLQQILERLNELIAEINLLRENLASVYEVRAQEELIPTELTLTVTPASVFVGDTVIASGMLTAEGSPLANRALTIFLNNKPLAINSKADGSYAATVNIPYEYVAKMTLAALYTPSADDIGTYLDSPSPTVTFDTSFYSTYLEVLAPANGYPGLPITIEGEVSSTADVVDRVLKVFLNTVELSSKTVQNRFSFQVTLPPQVSLGDQNLDVVVYPEERHSGTSESMAINITKLAIQADIQVPAIIVLPKTIQVSGQVYHGLSPLQNAEVSLTFRDFSTIVTTSADGSFMATLEAPVDLSLVGTQELVVIIEPAEPYYLPLRLTSRVFTVNPASISLILVVFVSVGLLVYSRGITGRRRQKGEGIIPEAETRQPTAKTPLSRPEYLFSGIKGEILLAYLDGLEVVERVTGISSAPHVTLREFLQTVRPLITGAIKPFTELTGMAEIALYSAGELAEDMAILAKEKATAVKREL